MFYESLWANNAILHCRCMRSASAAAFARPSLLFHADNCPHLNHRPTIGSNWHVASAVLGEIWGCIRPRTGCPLHQLKSCLLVGRGRGRSTSLLLCLLIKMICGDPFPLRSSLLSLPASLSPLRYYCLWTASESSDPNQRLTAVSGTFTFTLEVLWQWYCARQVFQWKCLTQLFAAGFLNITRWLSFLRELFFFSCDAALGLAEAEVSPNSWTWVFSLVAGVLALFFSLLCLQA